MLRIDKVILLLVSLVALYSPIHAAKDTKSLPNIVWILLEDWCPDMSVYGTTGIETPTCDAFATQGIRYNSAFTTAPVCSSARSAMITGCNQNYIGAHQHRTADHNQKALPCDILPFPQLLSDHGYFTCLMGYRKTDCNFTTHLGFQGKDWGERPNNTPFFAQITIGSTHRLWNRDPIRPIEENRVELPPYYADTPFNRRDWANGLEQMQIADREIDSILKRLENEGLAESTMVIISGDNGRCHIRGKQFLYDPGLHVPLLIRWPWHIKPGQINNELVSSLDITATILAAADISTETPLHGQDLLSTNYRPHSYIFAARDKMDDTHDAMRMVRSKRYKLIHNLMPERPWLQLNKYKERMYPMLAEMSILHQQGKLTPEQSIFFSKTKPKYELFDLQNDPHELDNLADHAGYASVKETLQEALDQWRQFINDQGVSEQFRAGGWPATYPTRSLEEWQQTKEKWKAWVFREPSSKQAYPF